MIEIKFGKQPAKKKERRKKGRRNVDTQTKKKSYFEKFVKKYTIEICVAVIATAIFLITKL